MNLCRALLGANGSVALGGCERAAVRGQAAAADRAETVIVGLRPEALELATDGVPARVEVVEELGADAYVFCAAELAGERVKLVARVETRRRPEAGRARLPAAAAGRGAPLRPGDRRAAPG